MKIHMLLEVLSCCIEFVSVLLLADIAVVIPASARLANAAAYRCSVYCAH
jgi:hypothetical protein